MNHSRLSPAALEALAEQDAVTVVALQKKGADGLALRKQQLEQFQRANQPHLSDKEYTALFRTYDNLFMSAVKNQYVPGSAVPLAPITPESIRDGDEIYRPRATPVGPGEWQAYLLEVEQMAERFAHEISALARNGVATAERMKEHQMEAARVGLEHGLDDAQFAEQAAVYKAKYLKTLEKAAAQSAPLGEGPDEQECRKIMEDHYRTFIALALAGRVADLAAYRLGFEERIEAIARGLSTPEASQMFIDRFNRERDSIADEYDRDPAALKRRLGISAGLAMPIRAQHSGQQLGNLVVNTAVRATVWESIFSIFRLFR
jgi:hypothetical protein